MYGSCSSFNVFSGVPKGSILGPFLLTIKMNDVGDLVKDSRLLIYADAIKLYKSVSDDVEDCVASQSDIQASRQVGVVPG